MRVCGFLSTVQGDDEEVSAVGWRPSLEEPVALPQRGPVNDEGAGGVAHDPAALDEMEQRFWREIWGVAVPDAVEEQGIALARFGPIQAMVVAELPDTPVLNLVLGAAEPGAVENGHLADATRWVESHGVDHCVPVTPDLAGTGATEDWLNRNGYERSHGKMRFLRDASPPAFPEPPGTGVDEILAGEGEIFSGLVAEGLELPLWGATFFHDLPGREGWRCYIAVDEDEYIVACATMLIHLGIATLGVAATRESARGKGCHLALLRRRILDAAAAGCHTLFADSHERNADRPSAGNRNLLRAGFEGAYLRPGWQPPSP